MNNTFLKSLGFVFFLLAFVVSLNAQNDRRSGIRFGLHSAQLRMDNEDFFDSNNKSLYVGLFRERKAVFGLMRWRTGLEYHQSGSYQDSDNFIRIGYVAIPVSLGLNLGPLHAFGGLSGQARIYNNETIDGERQDPTINDYNTFDATAFVGGTFKVLFIGFELQYNWGLTDVTQEFRNRYFELGLRFYF